MANMLDLPSFSSFNNKERKRRETKDYYSQAYGSGKSSGISFGSTENNGSRRVKAKRNNNSRSESYLTKEEQLEEKFISQQLSERRQKESLRKKRRALEEAEYREEHPYRYEAKEKAKRALRTYQTKSLKRVIGGGGGVRLRKLPSRSSVKSRTGYGDYFRL